MRRFEFVFEMALKSQRPPRDFLGLRTAHLRREATGGSSEEAMEFTGLKSMKIFRFEVCCAFRNGLLFHGLKKFPL